MLSFGDFGFDLWEVERELNFILELVLRWNVVLFFDECDVFFEVCSNYEIECNKIVIIFFWILEYYEGIMFLMINCCGEIDVVFQLCIYVSIEYFDFMVFVCKIIWKNFFWNLIIKSNFIDKDISEFFEFKFNGCQIKNVFKMVSLLVRRRKSDILEWQFIEMVFIIEKKWFGVFQQMMYYM